jgi:hypothetical protein
MVLSILKSRLHLGDDDSFGVLGVLLVMEEEVQLTGLDTTVDGGEDAVHRPLASLPADAPKRGFSATLTKEDIADALKRGFSIAMTKEEIAEDFPPTSDPCPARSSSSRRPPPVPAPLDHGAGVVAWSALAP